MFVCFDSGRTIAISPESPVPRFALVILLFVRRSAALSASLPVLSHSVVVAGVGAAGIGRSDVDCSIVAVLAPIEPSAVDAEVGFAHAILDDCGVSTPGQKNGRGFAAAVGGVDVRVRDVIINQPKSVAGCDDSPRVACKPRVRRAARMS